MGHSNSSEQQVYDSFVKCIGDGKIDNADNVLKEFVPNAKLREIFKKELFYHTIAAMALYHDFEFMEKLMDIIVKHGNIIGTPNNISQNIYEYQYIQISKDNTWHFVCDNRLLMSPQEILEQKVDMKNVVKKHLVPGIGEDTWVATGNLYVDREKHLGVKVIHVYDTNVFDFIRSLLDIYEDNDTQLKKLNMVKEKLKKIVN
jgi:hypothetical protein